MGNDKDENNNISGFCYTDIDSSLVFFYITMITDPTFYVVSSSATTLNSNDENNIVLAKQENVRILI